VMSGFAQLLIGALIAMALVILIADWDLWQERRHPHDFRGAQAVHRALDKLVRKYGYGRVLPPVTGWLDEAKRIARLTEKLDEPHRTPSPGA
jgi:hypothetical protein